MMLLGRRRSGRGEGATEGAGGAAPAGPDTAAVFVHGYLPPCSAVGFYWWGLRHLRRELEGAGCSVIWSAQPRTGAVEARAARLGAALEALPHRRLILVGHSMGGLDARYVASRLDPRGRVSDVITVGTPHLGTGAAEWALGDRDLRARLARLIDRGALKDLTPDGTHRLDRLMPDRDDVRYVALAGERAPGDLLAVTRDIGWRLTEAEGPNDGFVATASALRGEAAGPPITADHWDLIAAPAMPREVRRPLGERAVAAIRGAVRGALRAGPGDAGAAAAVRP